MKVAFHTLGCKVNQYETEAIARDFKEQGFDVVAEREFADVYVINTCTVTAMADKKSRQYIRRMKKVNPNSVVAVTGCYVQVKPDEVSAVEGVDIIAGTNEKSRLAEYVRGYLKEGVKQIHVKGYEELDAYDDTGLVSGIENRTRAYIKIQEGCDRFCAYCVIPYARGKVRSRPLQDIVAEAQQLIEAECKELVLTGINTALYAGGVGRVIAALSQLPGDFRIRLSSLEPAVVNAEYVKSLLQYEKLCHHLHLSAQSGSDAVLAAMNRPYSRKDYLDIVNVLREFDPLYGISTDIIVGFPGETEADFEDSCRLVEECAFCKTHIFKYSKRPFTKAADLKGHIAPQVKNRRSETLHRIGEKAAATYFHKKQGEIGKALLEELYEEKKLITGYTDHYTRVYVRYENREAAERLLNHFAEVKLLKPFGEGMMGEMI